MNIIFRPTDYSSDTDCAAIAKWSNCPILRKLWIPQQKNRDTLEAITPLQIREKRKSVAPEFTPAIDEMAILGDRVVGQISLILNPPHKRFPAEMVAWPSIIIGESSLRGRGVIRRFGNRILTAAKEIGASHIEAGVFEFNLGIRRLLEKAQFTEFDRVDQVTWQNGEAYSDIRYYRAI